MTDIQLIALLRALVKSRLECRPREFEKLMKQLEKWLATQPTDGVTAAGKSERSTHKTANARCAGSTTAGESQNALPR